jgi:hypothetical protein
MRERILIRVGLAYLALTELTVGIWAVADPSGFYRKFPGFGHHWVSVTGPYNQHLTSDAGAGFLAVGVLLVIAAAMIERTVVIQVALVVFLVHDVPHFLFHVVHHEHLSGFDKVGVVGGLGFGVLLGALLLVVMSRRTRVAAGRSRRRFGAMR